MVCGEVFREGVGCFFKPTVELIQITCQLLILLSAGGGGGGGGGGLVVSYLFQTFPHWKGAVLEILLPIYLVTCQYLVLLST